MRSATCVILFLWLTSEGCCHAADASAYAKAETAPTDVTPTAPSEAELAQLIQKLRDRKLPTPSRVQAMWSLYLHDLSLDSFDATAELTRALHNGPPGLRADAARALGKRPYKSAGVVKHLYRRMQRDTDPAVRRQCAVALGRIGDRSAAAALFASLNDPDNEARRAKIAALRAINYWPIAAGFVNSADPRIAEGTIAALHGVYEVDAVQALTIALRSTNAEVRESASRALRDVRLRPSVTEWWDWLAGISTGPVPEPHEWEGTAIVDAALEAAP